MCVPGCVSVHHIVPGACGRKRSEGGGIPRNRITDNFEPPCGYWELSLDPLLKLTWVLCTEPSLQLPGIQFDFKLNSYCVTW